MFVHISETLTFDMNYTYEVQKMKNILKEYLEISEQDKNNLWNESIFVFDTNVLLNMYRFSQKTRDALFSALEKLKDRIWLPYHVVQEYHKNRCETVYESIDKYDYIIKESDKFIEECKKSLRLQETEITALRQYLNNWLNNEKTQNLLVVTPLNDEILNKLLILFDNKVGMPYEQDKLDQIKKDAILRYENKIPPGYEDAKKINGAYDNNAYGDLIVWKQILDYAKENSKDVIFITSDQKGDWWFKAHGKTVGPRYELKKEFMTYTKRIFHLYSMESFLVKYSELYGVDTDQKVIEEIKVTDNFFDLNKIERLNNELKSIYISGNETQKSIKGNIESKEIKLHKQETAYKNLIEKYKNKRQPDNIYLQMIRLEDSIKRNKNEIKLLEDSLCSYL